MMRWTLASLALSACEGSNPARIEIDRQAAAAAQPVAKGGYGCPMHAQVHQDGPGTCPECGMALVPAPGGTD